MAITGVGVEKLGIAENQHCNVLRFANPEHRERVQIFDEGG
jgi:hypothetical protein